MHWTFLAPELSATSSIDRGWIIAYDARLRILRIRQRFSFDSGRVSSISTRSPTRLSFPSSCAFSFFDIRMTRSYRGCRYTRSIFTTRVFCIASLTTTPSRVFRSPTDLPLPLAEHGPGTREIPPRLTQPRRILRDAHRELEAKVEDLFAEVVRLLPELLVREIAPLRGLHRPSPMHARCSLTSSLDARSNRTTASVCASRTSSRCRSSVQPSETPRAPRLWARPASPRRLSPALLRSPTLP